MSCESVINFSEPDHLKSAVEGLVEFAEDNRAGFSKGKGINFETGLLIYAAMGVPTPSNTLTAHERHIEKAVKGRVVPFSMVECQYVPGFGLNVPGSDKIKRIPDGPDMWPDLVSLRGDSFKDREPVDEAYLKLVDLKKGSIFLPESYYLLNQSLRDNRLAGVCFRALELDGEKMGDVYLLHKSAREVLIWTLERISVEFALAGRGPSRDWINILYDVLYPTFDELPVDEDLVQPLRANHLRRGRSSIRAI